MQDRYLIIPSTTVICNYWFIYIRWRRRNISCNPSRPSPSSYWTSSADIPQSRKVPPSLGRYARNYRWRPRLRLPRRTFCTSPR